MDTNVFDPVTLTLQLGPLFENIYLNSNFSTVSSRTLIFHMSISSDNTFP